MKPFKYGRVVLLALLVVVTFYKNANAQQTIGLAIDPEDVRIGQKEYSPYLDRGFPQWVLRVLVFLVLLGLE